MAQDRESLRDLDGVRVAVDPLPEAAAAYGLSIAMLQRAAEDSLRRAGIRVLTTGDFPTGDPFLRIRVETTGEVRGSVAYTADVDFVQIVFMRRNPAVTFNRAQTWKAAGRLAIVEPREVSASVARDVGEQVDAFIGEYRAVNGT